MACHNFVKSCHHICSLPVPKGSEPNISTSSMSKSSTFLSSTHTAAWQRKYKNFPFQLKIPWDLLVGMQVFHHYSPTPPNSTAYTYEQQQQHIKPAYSLYMRDSWRESNRVSWKQYEIVGIGMINDNDFHFIFNSFSLFFS